MGIGRRGGTWGTSLISGGHGGTSLILRGHGGTSLILGEHHLYWGEHHLYWRNITRNVAMCKCACMVEPLDDMAHEGLLRKYVKDY